MSTINPEFPQQLIESWRDIYDLDEEDIDRAQKLWQEKVVKDNWAPELVLNQLEDSLKDRNQRVQAFKDEICEFVKLHYPLDEAFLKALDQKRTGLAEKFGHKKLGKLSDRFTDTTLIVSYRREDLQQYEQKVCELAQQTQSFQFSPDDWVSLKDLHQELDIADWIADRILNRQKYRHQVSKTIEQTGDRPTDDFLSSLRAVLALAESDVQDIDQELLTGLPPAQPQPTVPTPTQRSDNLRPELAAQIHSEVVQELQLDQSPQSEVEVKSTPHTPDPEPSVKPLVEPATPILKKEQEPKAYGNTTSQLPLPPPVVQPPRPRRHRESTGNQPTWLVGGVLAMLALTTGSVVAYQKMQNDRLISATLQQAEGFKTEKQYDRCITHITQASSTVQSSQQAKNLLASCQDGKADQRAISQFQVELNKAKTLKDKGSCGQAIDLLSQLPKPSLKTDAGRAEVAKLGDRAKTLKSDCAQNLLDIAKKDYNEGKKPVLEIISFLNRIPADTTAAAEAKALKVSYQTAWEADQSTIAALKQATANGRWNAVAYTQQLKTAYGQQQADPLITRAKAEIAAMAATSASTSGTGTSGTGTSGTGTSGTGTSGTGTSGTGTSGTGTSGTGTSGTGTTTTTVTIEDL
ncbi:MAG: hypothetical protein NZ772_13750 [Cyanobacteria bacterium]|nr:hypothetical protein [Cyanobacteriota bacterium]MDW8199803.1 hypothetical protein [Cyanobacteriota bacterium SKYGB_h_bin112]